MPVSLLLAEDNEDDVFFFRTAAKRLGWAHDIIVAQNGRETIDQLTRFGAGDSPAGRLSLVLLDLKMPFVSGLEVLEWARTRPELRFLPMCVFSSSEQQSDIEAAYRLGAASFLVKPSKPEELVELLRAVEAYWFRQNRLPTATLDRAGESPPSFSS